MYFSECVVTFFRYQIKKIFVTYVRTYIGTHRRDGGNSSFIDFEEIFYIHTLCIAQNHSCANCEKFILYLKQNIYFQFLDIWFECVELKNTETP